jgi:hypothetical protein
LVKLTRAIGSIVGTADDPQDLEICLRVHSDDLETLNALPALLRLGNIKVMIGKPLNWDGQVQGFDEAWKIAVGTWCIWFNDDCTIEGKGWDTQLKRATHGHIAICEWHKLGLSRYHRDKHVPMFFMPNGSWGSVGFPQRGDADLWAFYEKNLWRVHWLEGITLWHDRDERDCRRINDV